MLTDHTRCTRAAAPMPSAAAGVLAILGGGAARAGSPRASGPRLDACRSGSNAKGRCCPPARAARASFGMTRKASKRRPRTRKREPSARRRTTSDGAVSSLGDSAKTGGAATTSLEPRARGVSPEPWAGARQGRGGRGAPPTSPSTVTIYRQTPNLTQKSYKSSPPPALSSFKASKGSAAAIVRCT